MDFLGFHFHIGSQLFDASPYLQAVEAVLELVRQVRDRFGVRVSELNLGGGFGITYTTEERRPYRYYLDPMLERIAACFDALELPRPAVVIEPGRSIVGDAALSLYTVGAIKEIAGVRKYVAVDGGMRRLDAAEIYYLESEGHKVHFYTEKEDFVVPGTLKNYEEKLVGRAFARCNLSLIHI